MTHEKRLVSGNFTRGDGDEKDTQQFLRAASGPLGVGGVGGRVSIDVPDAQTFFLGLLGELGFPAERPFSRMILDDPPEPGELERCFAIAGPEFG